ncbi:MAG: hypothetical protein ACK4RN_17735 [Pseudorhodobacter sp.]
MADYEATGEELEKLVRLGRRRSMPFAFCPANGEDESLFATHRKKKPELIAKSARKASGQSKVAFGFFTVEKKTLNLVLHRELPQIAKRLKKHLRRERLWLNIRIFDLLGNELESDIEEVPPEEAADWADAEDEADDPDNADSAPVPQGKAARKPATEPSGALTGAGDAASGRAQDSESDDDDEEDAADPDAPDPAALLRGLRRLQPKINALDGATAATLKAATASVLTLIRDGELYRAEATIEAVGRVLTRLGPAPAALRGQGEATSALDMAQRLRTLRRIAETSPSPLRERLLRAVTLVAGLLRSGDLDRANAALPRLAELAAKGADRRP